MRLCAPGNRLRDESVDADFLLSNGEDEEDDLDSFLEHLESSDLDIVEPAILEYDQFRIVEKERDIEEQREGLWEVYSLKSSNGNLYVIEAKDGSVEELSRFGDYDGWID